MNIPDIKQIFVSIRNLVNLAVSPLELNVKKINIFRTLLLRLIYFGDIFCIKSDVFAYNLWEGCVHIS